ncbi:hypothetical protein ACWCQZ_00130 [Streptomyces sp. NPDC002285]
MLRSAFNAGVFDDILLIWQAKTAGMDTDCSIDIDLLCGSGLATTKEYLTSRDSPKADVALQRLISREDAGDFEGFTVEGHSTWYAEYYMP